MPAPGHAMLVRRERAALTRAGMVTGGRPKQLPRRLGNRQGATAGIPRGGSGISPIENARATSKLPIMRSDAG